MYPILLQVGGFKLHSYGVLVGVAILAAIWVATREARRKGFAGEVIGDLALPVVLTGLVGGRLAYVLGWEPELFSQDPLGIFAVWRGGLALHGGLLAGFGAGFWFCWRRRLNPWVLADALAPAIILGQGIGRLSCFLNGDAYGRATGVPWAVIFSNPDALAPLGVPLHPVQLYEFAADLMLFGVLWVLRKRPGFEGQLFLFYLAGYGVIRLLTEVFRGDRVEVAFGLSLLQGASLALLVTALVAFGWRLTTRKARTASA
jgi:phosphatidylglycerol:prolipoprotein diacylglycerol transferase